METNSSGEDLVVKMRKPYTIMKQREKWTEEEHNKFIEALKLYGRAWQRIEEHIGTKTAVQIRSHAQKFFTKLEKEAVMKGVPLGQAHDIEIPPPRPKRKPSCPYPRKTGAGSFSPSGEALEEKTPKSSSFSTCKQAIDIENNASWKIQGARDNSEDGSCSEVLNLFQDAPAASISSLTKGSAGLCAYNGFMPLNKEMKDKATLKGSSMSIEANRHMKGNGTANANHGSGELKGNCKSSQMNSAQEGAEISKQPGKISSLANNPRGDQSSTKHVPIDFVKRSGDGNVPATITGQDRAHVNAKPSTIPAISSTSEMNTNFGISSIHPSFPALSPFTQFPSSQDAYHSFLNISSTFSSLIVSTLLQNPAVHAAASVATSFWPPAGLDVPVDSPSETVHGGIPTSSMNPTPSMAAIAAATVEAASAWWATQGLLPIYPPLHTGFTFAPALTTTTPTVDTAQASDSRKEERGDRFENSIGIDQQDVTPEQSEAVRAQHPSSKSLSSSSDSEESARGEPMGAKTNKFKPLLNNGVNDSDKARNKKKLDRSSCGSNTPSSSEVETDAVLKKQDGDKDEAKQAQQNNPPSAETSDRQIRSSSSMNESWKEVSEEGRLAFKALFNREVLPQSFSPPHAKNLLVMTAKAKEATNELPFDLNVKASSEPTDVYYVQEFGDKSGKGPLTSDISQGKLKAHRTGFKPYKRCSMEAKESRGVTRRATGNETGNKRIRLEGETCI